jgi:putative tricarboxylic transport membrane protein
MEEYFRSALLLTQGNPAVFMERPISAILLGLSLVLVVILFLPAIRRGRELVFRE